MKLFIQKSLVRQTTSNLLSLIISQKSVTNQQNMAKHLIFFFFSTDKSLQETITLTSKGYEHYLTP